MQFFVNLQALLPLHKYELGDYDALRCQVFINKTLLANGN